MKWFTLLCLLPVSAVACREGFTPSDTPGVCVEKSVEVTNPAWVSDERPPQSGWNPDRSNAVSAPELTAQDIKADQEKAQANRDGKKAAGIKP
jgi:hypothetical protein